MAIVDDDWLFCNEHGCKGACLLDGNKCLAHASKKDVENALNLFSNGGGLDAQGVRIDALLLQRILDAASREGNGPPRLVRAKFQKSIIPSYSNFSGFRLQGCNFAQASFGQGVNFSRTTFEEVADFSAAIFQSEPNFSGVDFGKSATFGRARLGDRANFSSAHFGSWANFHKARFGVSADFSNADVGDSANFNDVVFGARATFYQTSFGSLATFEGAEFGDWADFRGATFQEQSTFTEVEFQDWSRFESSQFGDRAKFSKARFGDSADFGKAKFGELSDFSKAKFGDNTLFSKAEIGNFTSFDSATFGSWAVFDEATLGDATQFTRASFGDQAQFKGLRMGEGGGFSAVTFGSQATLLGVLGLQSLIFADVTFGDGAVLLVSAAPKDKTDNISPFSEMILIGHTTFGRNCTLIVHANWLLCQGTTFAEGTSIQVHHGTIVVMSTAFLGPSMLLGGDLSAGIGYSQDELSRLRDLLGEDVVRKVTSLVLDSGGPTLSKFLPDSEGAELADRGMPRLISTDHSDMANLTIARVDLRPCSFTRAHNLEQVRFEPQTSLALTPSGWHFRRTWPPVWRWTLRRSLAEEHAWRSDYESGCRKVGWYPNDVRPIPPRQLDSMVRQLLLNREQLDAMDELLYGRQPIAQPQRRDQGISKGEGSHVSDRRDRAQALAMTYRALRKGREDSKDEPGAADFYYGEMEMRRQATPKSFERAVLTMYWLVSGYALRASRSLVALLAVLVLGAGIFANIGFTPQPPVAYAPAGVSSTGELRYQRQEVRNPTRWQRYTTAFLYSAESAISLLRPPPSRSLTTVGECTQIALRLVGPVLFGLAVLSLRGRVKR